MGDNSARPKDSAEMSLSSPNASPPEASVVISEKGKKKQQQQEDDEEKEDEDATLPPLVPVQDVSSMAAAHVSDPLLDLSMSLTVQRAEGGQLFGFLAVYAALGRQGVAAMARGELELPPPESRCHAALCRLAAHVPRSSREGVPGASSSAADAALRELEPLPASEHGSAADALARGLYARVLAFVLQENVLAHELACPGQVVRAFSSGDLRVPALSLLRFVERLLRYLPATKELFVVALIYVDRALAADPLLRITATNVHRLYFAAVVAASKFFDDHFFANAVTARVAGLTRTDMKELEVEFLAAVSFSLYVDDALYRAYLEPFEQLVALVHFLPLDPDNDALPPARPYPPCGKWTWTPLDELFYHIQLERQKLGSALDTSTAALFSGDAQLSQSIEQQQQRISSLLSPPSTTTITREFRKSYATIPQSNDPIPRNNKNPAPHPQQTRPVHPTHSSSGSKKSKHSSTKSSGKTSEVSFDASKPIKRMMDKTSTSTTEWDEKKQDHHHHHHHHHKRKKATTDSTNVQKDPIPHHTSSIMSDGQQSGYRSA